MAGLFFSRFRKQAKTDHPYCAAVVAAAGSAQRMDGIDKVLAELGGMPVLARTLLALENCTRIDEIVIVTRSDLCVPVGKLCHTFGIGKAKAVVKGGATRAESVRLGRRRSRIRRSWRPFTTAPALCLTGAVGPGSVRRCRDRRRSSGSARKGHRKTGGTGDRSGDR